MATRSEYEAEIARLESVVANLEREVAQLRPLVPEVVELLRQLAAREGDAERLAVVEAEMALVKQQVADLTLSHAIGQGQGGTGCFPIILLWIIFSVVSGGITGLALVFFQDAKK